MADVPTTRSSGPAGRIRPVQRDDVPALKEIIDRSELFPSDMLDDMLAGFLGGEAGDDLWLTVDDGGPLAIAYCAPERMTEGTWNLLLIAVRSDRQGRGIGATLMEHVEGTLAERGERVLLVETSGLPEFERTRRFYRSLGYDEEARTRDFYDAGEDKVVFWKAVAGSRAG